MCTSILQIAKDGTHFLSRTMDWHRMGSMPLFSPRQYEWKSVYNNHTYYNKYALIGGGGPHDDEIDVSDGINEWGLSVQKLTFTNGSKLSVKRNDDKVQLAPFELPFYLLGNFKSVAEIEAHIDEIELMGDEEADRKYGHPELHFTVLDKTGRIVVIEPTTQPMAIKNNPLGILTNSYNFEKQISQLSDYMEFTPEFKNGTVPLNTPKVTTGNFSGKKVPTGSFTPGSRFIRAAYDKERANIPANEEEAVVSSWHLLNGVSVPRSTDHRSTYSIYRAGTSSESLTYYFEPYDRMSIVKLQLTPEMLTWTKPKFYSVVDDLVVDDLNLRDTVTGA
ncbi:penicillin V acylase related amidase [Secundilactobacillus oryzae JCM 18671]|uniref:Penicillin V acylase related amidase n=1 Tax=Secundilactobacillus oryzae JCM 18671 TaxID=1291743 RepID=A0A081BHX2_9LACO|nr:choloylglycine hydrolase family protein [Secundilactobacillus oryzae]GAK47640.1 penicillin V acylase related amidase [Secundilactobacillus oryzae JCM 18671]